MTTATELMDITDFRRRLGRALCGALLITVMHASLASGTMLSGLGSAIAGGPPPLFVTHGQSTVKAALGTTCWTPPPVDGVRAGGVCGDFSTQPIGGTMSVRPGWRLGVDTMSSNTYLTASLMRVRRDSTTTVAELPVQRRLNDSRRWLVTLPAHRIRGANAMMISVLYRGVSFDYPIRGDGSWGIGLRYRAER